MLKLIARYRIAPGTLILEVTESCRMDDPQDVMARLRPLRGPGCRLRWMILAWVMPGCTSYSR